MRNWVKHCHTSLLRPITILAKFYCKSRYEKLYWQDFCLPLKELVIIFLFLSRCEAFGSLFRTEKKVVKLWDFNKKGLPRASVVRAFIVKFSPTFSTIFLEILHFWPYFVIPFLTLIYKHSLQSVCQSVCFVNLGPLAQYSTKTGIFGVLMSFWLLFDSYLTLIYEHSMQSVCRCVYWWWPRIQLRHPRKEIHWIRPH